MKGELHGIFCNYYKGHIISTVEINHSHKNFENCHKKKVKIITPTFFHFKIAKGPLNFYIK